MRPEDVRGAERIHSAQVEFPPANSVITIFLLPEPLHTSLSSSELTDSTETISLLRRKYTGYKDNWMPRLYFFIFPQWYWRNASWKGRFKLSENKSVDFFHCWFEERELLSVPLPPLTYVLHSLNYARWLYDVVLWIVNSHNYTSHCLFIISKRMGNYVKLSLKRRAACNMTCHIVHAIQILLRLFSPRVESNQI